jgi:hypothetical protein
VASTAKLYFKSRLTSSTVRTRTADLPTLCPRAVSVFKPAFLHYNLARFIDEKERKGTKIENWVDVIEELP